EPISPTQLQPGCPRDLATIVLKCLEKLPKRRYADAIALGDDLRRFQEGRAILARPVSKSERVVKWARRRPAVAGLLTTVVVLLLGGGVLVTYSWLATADALESTKKARAEIAQALQDTMEAQANTAKALAETEAARKKTADALAEKLMTLAKYDFSQNKIDEVRKHLAAIAPPYRDKEWRYLDRHVNAERARFVAEGRVSQLLF